MLNQVALTEPLSYEGVIVLGKYLMQINDMNLDTVDESKSVYGAIQGPS
jgi:hypothetical protein